MSKASRLSAAHIITQANGNLSLKAKNLSSIVALLSAAEKSSWAKASIGQRAHLNEAFGDG